MGPKNPETMPLPPPVWFTTRGCEPNWWRYLVRTGGAVLGVVLGLGDFDIECAVEAQGSRQRRNDLGEQPMQIRVGRTFDIQAASANVLRYHTGW